MAESIPRAPDQYDKSGEQNMRRIVENRITDLEQAIYGLRTSYGTVSLGETTLELSAGANNNVAPGYATFVRISEPSGGAFSISGFAEGEKGRLLILLNKTGQNMTLTHEATSSAANQITTMTGADVATTADGAAILLYDSVSEKWQALFVST